MKIGYLMNTYPLISTTFIRREIHAHEAAGFEVQRFAIRKWNQSVVDPLDQKEMDFTTYLLDRGLARLTMGALWECATNLSGFSRALVTTLSLARRKGGTGLRNFAYLLEAVYFKQRACNMGIDHVHAHFSTNSTAVALLSRRMGGPAYSFTAHGPDEFDDTEANGLPVKVHYAAFVAAITHYAKGVVSAATDSQYDDKIHIVRCGIDLNEFNVLPIFNNSRILCVGRLCPAKAQSLLVDAIAPLIADHPELELVFIGDGEDRAQIESRIGELGLQKHVTLAGWGTGAQVQAAIAQARIFALPSYAEGLPIVLMECLAVGRPVISSRITGIPELVTEDCGWLVPPGSITDLTQAIAAALTATPETLTTMGLAGRQRVAQMHDQTVNAKELRDLMQPCPGG